MRSLIYTLTKCAIFCALFFSLELKAQNCGFRVLQSSGCAPFFVTIVDTTSPAASITSRTWTISGPIPNDVSTWNGTGVNNSSYGKFYNTPGCYNVSMTVTVNGVPCTKTVSCAFRVNGAPRINATVTPASGRICPGLPVNLVPQLTLNTFGGSGCTSVDTMFVDWAGGVPSTEVFYGNIPASLTHTYPNDLGSCYPIKIYARDNCGCPASRYVDTICVDPAPTPDFSIDKAYNCAAPFLDTVRATPIGGAGAYTYEWYIDANTSPQITSNSPIAALTFPAGSHSVTLKVTDNITGCSTSVTKANIVDVGTFPAAPFVASPSSGCDTLNTTLLPPGSLSPPPVSYSWVVNGALYTGSLTGNGVPPTLDLSYPTKGRYVVKLIVNYSGGCADTTIQVIQVGTKINVNFKTPDSTFCSLPDTACFTNNSAACPGCSYVWTLTTGQSQTGIGPACFPITSFGAIGASLVVTDTAGCASSFFRDSVIIAQPLRIRITKNRVGACVGDTFVLVNRTAAPGCPIISKTWDFPGANLIPTANSDSLKFTLGSTGCFKFTYIMQTQCGCIDTLRDSVEVGRKINFTVTDTPNLICYEQRMVKFNVTFVDTPTMSCASPNFKPFDNFGLIPEYPVDSHRVIFFRDTTIVSDTLVKLDFSISHQYQNFGDFIPKIFYNDNGCSSDTLQLTPVKVNAPAANFVDSTKCGFPFRKYLYDKSRQATSIRWVVYNSCADSTATDSTVITSRDTFVDFPGCGCYFVRMDAYNDTTGCTHTKKGTLKISCPITNLTQLQSRGCVPFSNTVRAVIPPGTNTSGYTYDWDINTADGIQFTGANAGTDSTFSFTRLTAGIYQVAMQITYPSGCHDTVLANFRDTATSVTASFTVDRDYGCTPLTVNVTSTTITPQFTTVTSSYYTNGISGTHVNVTPNPQFTYNTLGPFAITLNVTSREGCNYTATRIVNPNVITASFQSSDDTTCTNSPHPFVFTNTSTGIIARYKWTAGPNAVYTDSTSRNFTANFTTEGLKRICLYTFDSLNLCPDSVCHTVYVRNPHACFRIADSVGACPPLLDSFFNCSTGSSLQYFWNFGDGSNISPEFQPKHIFSDAGKFTITLTIKDNDQCVDTAVKKVITIDGPYASLTTSNNSGCPCQDVKYHLSTVKTFAAYLILGCGPIISFPNITPVGSDSFPTVLDTTVRICQTAYCPATLYLVGSGCNDTVNPRNNAIAVVDSPIVNFKMLNRVCDKGRICFFDQSRDTLSPNVTISKYFWYWGDGTPADSVTPTPTACHQYNAPGWYVVRHGVRNSAGCYKEKSDSIYISRKPDISMLVSDTVGCTPLNVNHSVNSIYVDPRTYLSVFNWNFNDPASGANNTSALNAPSHVYNNVGTFNPTIIVTDTFGCKDTATRRIQVFAAPTANAGTDKKLCLGNSLVLNGTGGVSCSWSPLYQITNPTTCNPTVNPLVTTDYFLTITDVHGCQKSDTVRITVSDVTASFTADTVCKGFNSHFVSTSTYITDTINSYTWNFGGIGTGTGKTPTFLFPDTGCYNTRLIVANATGCRDTAFGSACIAAPPLASFSFDTVCNGDSTCFHNQSATSIGAIINNYWNFGDGTSDSIQSDPCHVYASSGSYNVRLTVCNSGHCCKDTIIKVVVRRAPIAAFRADSVCFGSTTNFTDLTVAGTGVLTSEFWQYSLPSATSDTSYTMGNTSFQYPAAGVRNVKLTVTDQFGCSADSTRPVIVYANPDAQFTVNTACVNNAARFTDASVKGTVGIQDWNWTFLTAPLTDNTRNPIHYFSSVNAVNPVKLTVIDSVGCFDTLITNVAVYDVPSAVINTTDSILCLGEAINLVNNSTAGTTAPIDSVNWDLQPDGIWDFVNQNNINYTYPAFGTYNACAIVKDAFCADTACIKVRVNRLPVANFNNDSNCIGIPTHVNSISVPGDGAINHFVWEYGNPPQFIDSPSASSSYAFTASGPVP
ncbi:MAG: PKD domain-containing protein, partial [Chitinophagales bacterium]